MRMKCLVVLLLVSGVGSSFANVIETVQPGPAVGAVTVATPVELTIRFGVPSDKVSCGLSVDWGDGEKQQLRVGPEQQLTPPFKLQHTYKSAATYKVAISGEVIFRGLRTVAACSGGYAGTITVVDTPVDPSARTASAVQAATSSLLAEAPCSPERAQSWVDGIRTLYCRLSPRLGLSQVEQLSGVRVFLGGPHDRQPNWRANTFGRYNPAFVSWAFDRLLSEKSPVAQQAYDRFGRTLARSLLVAHVRLRTNGAELSALANRYRGGSSANLDGYFRDNLDRDADLRAVMANGESTAYLFPVVMGFWARREVDGTIALFYAGLRKTLERFDPDFLRRRDPGNDANRGATGGPGAPRLIAETAGNVTNVRVEGQLASTYNVGCIALAEVRNVYAPPDLYRGVTDCLARGNYDQAVGLFALAGAYAIFDGERVADRTAAQARNVLVSNTLLPETDEKKAQFTDTFNRIVKNPQLLAKLCGDVQRVGMPNYYPAYMILHGARALTGNPHENALVRDFDASVAWKKIQVAYVNCPA